MDSSTFILACKNGQVDVVSRAVSEMDLPQVDHEGQTALMWADFRGNTTIVKALVPHSDLKQKSRLGRDALMNAIAGEANLDLIRLLISASTPKPADRKGRTALMFAVRKGDLDIVRLLVHISEAGDYGPYIFFYQTKNGRNHRLPLGRMTLELLRRRQEACVEEVERRGFGSKSRQFVFPARSRFSKTGHYSDATALLESLREEAEIPRLANHDLRRSFGAVMTSLDVPDTIKRCFLNHADASVTDTYTKPEWAMLKGWMERIEQGILPKGPNVYNALKPIDWPAIAAPDPHVCRPAKARSGRPKKIDLADPSVVA